MSALELAIQELNKRFNSKLRSGLSGREFCDIHEKWAKSSENRIELPDGSVVSMDNQFAYLYLIQKNGECHGGRK